MIGKNIGERLFTKGGDIHQGITQQVNMYGGDTRKTKTSLANNYYFKGELP